MAEDILKYLEKVLQSSEFQNSVKYQKLLEYLVHSTLVGNIPKEITIAMELFGAEMNEDTLGESNIRVYIHNVRKKLDSYYNNEGAAHTWIVARGFRGSSGGNSYPSQYTCSPGKYFHIRSGRNIHHVHPLSHPH